MRVLWAQMLATVRGVGPEIAEAVATQFPTVSLLMRRLQEARLESEGAAERLLAGVRLSGSRTVGTRTARAIYRKLCGIGD